MQLRGNALRSHPMPKPAQRVLDAGFELAGAALPKEHWPQLHSTNPLERLNGEIKRRTDVVAIFPNEAAIVRLVGAMLLEQNHEWAASRARYNEPGKARPGQR
jgi:transposase-like protein